MTDSERERKYNDPSMLDFIIVARMEARGGPESLSDYHQYTEFWSALCDPDPEIQASLFQWAQGMLSDTTNGMVSFEGGRRGAATRHQEATDRYQAIVRAYRARRLHNLGEPDYTARQRIAAQFKVATKTVDRAIRSARKEK